ncbi:MAG TPA: Spy/CpxP family protein refolding chaperone [Methylocystis sp.]|nr:Spy/CpxP family protein refolding chaperone [Methylocystis sp.]
MHKRLAVAAVAAALLMPQLPSAAFAAGEEEHGGPPHFSAEDRGAFLDARIAALKAGLKLTPAQEKNWPAVESAIRDLAKARAERTEELHGKPGEHEAHRNLIEALQGSAKRLQAHAAEISKLADAAKPLYESLDDAQKRRLGVLLHHLHGHEGHGPGHWGGGHWGGHWGGQGPE